MTDRSETDRVTLKWRLIKRIDDQRALVHAGVVETWKRFKQQRRSPNQQHQMELVIAMALSQLAECDHMEQSLKR